MSDAWDDFDEAGWDPLAAPDPPSDVEPDVEDEPRIGTDWPADDPDG